MSTNTRIRGLTLQRIRKRVLQAQPLCVHCLQRGVTRLATTVDHIVPVCKGGADDPHDDSNRQGLCEQCHAIKTAADLNYDRTTIGADGWPVADNRGDHGR